MVQTNRQDSEYKYMYTKSTKIHIIRTDVRSNCEQAASFYL